MKITFFLLFSSLFLYSQKDIQQYLALTKKADSLYAIKHYKSSALVYSEAFQTQGGNATLEHRYKVGCAWALANYPDSAFYNLFRAARKGKYNNYQSIISDSSLAGLHRDVRWDSLLFIINNNFQIVEAKINKPVKKMLDSILTEDQKYRLQLKEMEKVYGQNSSQVSDTWKTINLIDNSNLVAVSSILDKNGWLGADEVGENGAEALFLVIQHADLVSQEKYLPMMRQAVKNKKAFAGNLALLEDRVALGIGKKQIYGSQVGRDAITGNYYVLPLEDPDNVDVRRASVGLQPLGEYVAFWKIKWDVNEYKKANQK